MKIVCRDCGRIMPTKSVPYHCVCGCGRILICLGEQLNCEVLANGVKHTKAIIENINQARLDKRGYLEKARYYAEKYPTKH